MKAASPHALLRAQFLRFAIVGTVGFVVDESVLALMHDLIGLPAPVARAISIFVAMIWTWWGNRNLTFHEHAAKGRRAMAFEFLRFAAASSVGASINYGAFLLLLHAARAPFNNPYLATVAGVGIGMVFNFASSRFLVFSAPAKTSEETS